MSLHIGAQDRRYSTVASRDAIDSEIGSVKAESYIDSASRGLDRSEEG